MLGANATPRVYDDCSVSAASAAADSVATIAASLASTIFASGFLSATLLGIVGAAHGTFCSLREPKVTHRPGELRSEEKDLRGVVDPDHGHDQRPGRAERRRQATPAM